MAQYIGQKPLHVQVMERFSSQLQGTHASNVVPIISVEKMEMIEHMPGVVMEATIPVAARALAKSTHRIATPEEYDDYKRDLKERTIALKLLEDDKKGIVRSAPAPAPAVDAQRSKRLEARPEER